MFKPITESSRSNLEFVFTGLSGTGVVIVCILQLIEYLFNIDLKGIQVVLLVPTGLSLIGFAIYKFYPKSKIVKKTDDSEVR